MIILYGKLRKQFGKIIGAKVNSVQELMKAAEANRPGFAASIDRDRGYIIKRGSDFRKAQHVEEEELEMRFADTTWHVLPMPVGHGNVLKIVLGAVLLVVGYLVPVTSPFMAKLGSGLMAAGFGLALSGVAGLLAPSMSTNYGDRDSPDERPSYLFNGPTNRVAAGNPVPLVFGFDVFVGSIFISGGLEIGDIA